MNANLLYGYREEKNTFKKKCNVCLHVERVLDRDYCIYGINAIDTFKSFINNIVITKYLT